MTAGDVAALMLALNNADPVGVIAVAPRLAEVDRTVAWRELRSMLVAGPDDRRGLTATEWRQQVRARSLVALAVGPSDVIRQVGPWIFLPELPAEAARALTTRAPGWRKEFSVATLQTLVAVREVGLIGPSWWRWWQQLRHWERGAVLRFDTTAPSYLVLMVRGLLFSGSIVDGLQADQELTECSLWALFEPADGVQTALVGGERYWDQTNTWRVALARLAIGGILDRDRLASVATTAANDPRMARNHRAWYRRITPTHR